MFEYGLCSLSLMPLYSQATQKSELVSQLLLGDIYQIIDKTPDNQWFMIQNHYDKYQGWIDASQFRPITNHIFEKYTQAEELYITTNLAMIWQGEKTFWASAGCYLPLFNPSNKSFYLGEQQAFLMDNNYKKVSPESTDFILKTAQIYNHAPYLWGGKNLFGIDCSGFTQQVFKIAGYHLWRDAKQQATQGVQINFIEQKPTDLAFFHRDGNVVHVGIILPNQMIMHALDAVRIDKLDRTGIWNSEKNNYSHQLYSIRRLIN